MPIQSWANVYNTSFQGLWYGVVQYIPNIVIAIVIFVIGWLIASALGRLVAQVVGAVKLDAMLKPTGLPEVVERAGMTMDSGAFLGGLVKWFFVIAFLVASLNVLHLTQVNDFLVTAVLSYLPRVIVAALIVLVGAVLAQVSKEIVSGSAKAAGIHAAGFAGSMTKWAIWVFAILAALAQLQVAAAFVQTLFTGVIVALSLAFGLAFGLGGQEAAARYIERVRSELGNHK